jgi:hypothetical protein
MEIPMLEEQEWREVWPLLAESEEGRQAAMALYKQITGFDETNPNAIAHHRVALYGPPCGNCGRPFRSPRASFCAACGVTRTTH